jgi:CheY-like chemotaxis protein
MDIKMPVMDGLEATREIKSFRKILPVIAITAFAMSGDEKRANEAGCDDYIAKPFER